MAVLLRCCVVWVCLCLGAGGAQATSISAALTAETVEVKTDFTGALISIYGAVDSRYSRATDVVVIARGPDTTIRLARKSRVAGLWLDTAPVDFRPVPGFYLAASTRPLSDVATFGQRRILALGAEHLFLPTPDHERAILRYGVPVVINTLGADYDAYRAGLLRQMMQRGLYVTDPFGVRFIDGGLFRADLRLPSRAPAGAYAISIYLFRDGKLLAERTRVLQVERVGLERAIHIMAHQHPWIYGLGVLAMAVLVGMVAAFVFRRRWI